jgi:hypothetical protein
MTKAKAHAHAADTPSTPTGAGHYGLVASASEAPKTVGLTDPNTATGAIVCRQNAPRACLPTLLNIETALKTATPLSKSP